MSKDAKSRCRSSTPQTGDIVNWLLHRAVLAGERDALYWPAFPLGRLAVTQGVADSIPREDASQGIVRHGRCDWGDLCPEDRAVNNAALRHGDRLLSKYYAGDGTAFYVITEWDRSVTTILLPEEY